MKSVRLRSGHKVGGNFLKVRYGAYHHRDVPKEDEELTHVGPGTPCGEYLRRYWQPVALSQDLQDRPEAVKIMGEEVIVFRDKSGRLGCLELHCSHRGASLEFGVLAERGIRCCYHGWHFDVDGTILETPTETADSTLKERLFHGAYPTHEYNGLVFIYMGPPDKKPAFPIFDTYSVPGYHQVTGFPYIMPCNWLQLKDNAADPMHIPILHQRISGYHFSGYRYDDDLLPELDWVETPLGVISGLVGRTGEVVWVRWTEYIRPNIHQFHVVESNGDSVVDRFCPPRAMRWHVPVDDTHTAIFDFQQLTDREMDRAEKILKSFGQRGDRPYEEQQRRPSDYEAQVSQRPIAIHAMEHLGASDRGVIMLRKMLRQEIRGIRRGKDPKPICTKEGEIIPTYLRNTAFIVPRAPTVDDDRRIWRDMASKVAEEALGDQESRWREKVTVTPY